jgi:hypothetical protein
MEVRMKTKLIIVSLGVLFFGACGGSTDGIQTEVGESSTSPGVVGDSVTGDDVSNQDGNSGEPQVAVRARWDNRFYTYREGTEADLDFSVRTPQGHVVTRGGSADGCKHSGNDLGADGEGAESIICSDPVPGDYVFTVYNNETYDVQTSGYDFDMQISDSIWNGNMSTGPLAGHSSRTFTYTVVTVK